MDNKNIQTKQTPTPTALTPQVMKWIVRTFNYLALASIIGIAGLFIYLLTMLPIEYTRANRELSDSLGTAGIVFGFLPLLGLLIKYGLVLIKKMQWLPENNMAVLIAKDILKWERQTRLALAWLGIIPISAHFVIYGSYLDNEFRKWDAQNILGVIGYGQLIVMNLNGIAMTIMRTRKFHVDKIKYLGYTNLTLGLTFFLIGILHIVL